MGDGECLGLGAAGRKTGGYAATVPYRSPTHHVDVAGASGRGGSASLCGDPGV